MWFLELCKCKTRVRCAPAPGRVRRNCEENPIGQRWTKKVWKNLIGWRWTKHFLVFCIRFGRDTMSRRSSCPDPVLFVVWFCNCKDAVHSSSCNWEHNCPLQDDVYNQIQSASTLNSSRHLHLTTLWLFQFGSQGQPLSFITWLSSHSARATLHDNVSQHLLFLKFNERP
jgi:hypothetical protein